MRGDRVGLGIGLFFAAAGVLFLLEALDVLRIRAAYVWPLLLIGLGVALLLGGIRRPEPEPARPEGPPEAAGAREEAGAEPPAEEPGEPPAEEPRDEPPT